MKFLLFVCVDTFICMFVRYQVIIAHVILTYLSAADIYIGYNLPQLYNILAFWEIEILPGILSRVYRIFYFGCIHGFIFRRGSRAAVHLSDLQSSRRLAERETHLPELQCL